MARRPSVKIVKRRSRGAALGDDEVDVIISTGQVVRREFLRNPVVLWQRLADLPPVSRGEDLLAGPRGRYHRSRAISAGRGSPMGNRIRGFAKARRSMEEW
jgi:hypothetical protein